MKCGFNLILHLISLIENLGLGIKRVEHLAFCEKPNNNSSTQHLWKLRFIHVPYHDTEKLHLQFCASILYHSRQGLHFNLKFPKPSVVPQSRESRRKIQYLAMFLVPKKTVLCKQIRGHSLRLEYPGWLLQLHVFSAGMGEATGGWPNIYLLSMQLGLSYNMMDSEQLDFFHDERLLQSAKVSGFRPF